MGGLIVVERNVKPDLRVFQDVNELSLRAAEAVTSTIADAVHATGRCSLVLSGGSTPRTLYRLLASRFREQIPWAHVHVFWGDERYVPPGDGRSNYRMAKETLLDHVPCPADPPVRLTLTFPLLNRAANAYFLVTGSNKARALHHILRGTADPNTFPAAGVRLAAGQSIWWVDRDAAAQQVDPDLHKGAIEGDRPDDEQQGNANVPALDERGLPAKLKAIAEDRIGANVDDSEVANADETGRTTGASRDEVPARLGLPLWRNTLRTCSSSRNAARHSGFASWRTSCIPCTLRLPIFTTPSTRTSCQCRSL